MCIPLALFGVVGGWSVVWCCGRHVARSVWVLLWVAWYAELRWGREVVAAHCLRFGLLAWCVVLVVLVLVSLGEGVCRG